MCAGGAAQSDFGARWGTAAFAWTPAGRALHFVSHFPAVLPPAVPHAPAARRVVASRPRLGAEGWSASWGGGRWGRFPQTSLAGGAPPLLADVVTSAWQPRETESVKIRSISLYILKSFDCRKFQTYTKRKQIGGPHAFQRGTSRSRLCWPLPNPAWLPLQLSMKLQSLRLQLLSLLLGSSPHIPAH